MSWKESKLYSILTLTCPYCHEAPFFVSHPYDLPRAGDIHDACPNCGGNNAKEPGFYYGAMYVSYGLGVGLGLIFFLLVNALFPDLPLYWIVIAHAGIMVFGGPYLYALSKSIWANLFISYARPVSK
jgi:hypothetical protein